MVKASNNAHYSIVFTFRRRPTQKELQAFRERLTAAVLQVANTSGCTMPRLDGPPFTPSNQRLTEKSFGFLFHMARCTTTEKPLTIRQMTEANGAPALTEEAARIQVTRLYKKGFVEWTRDTRDFRIRLWSLTPEGADALRAYQGRD